MFALYVVSRSNYMVANIIIVKFRVRGINRGAHPDDHINNNKKKTIQWSNSKEQQRASIQT